jgi:hypothetical protein
MKEIYVVKMITGAGYDCDDAGYFETKADAAMAVSDHLIGKGLVAYYQEKTSDFDGRTCFSYHVTNKPYFLEFNIFKEEFNKLRV